MPSLFKFFGFGSDSCFRKPTPPNHKFVNVSQLEGGICLQTNNVESAQYLARNFFVYQYYLTSDGAPAPKFKYTPEEPKDELAFQISGDVAGVLNWLKKDSLLTDDCAKRCDRLLLPPSPFLKMELASQHAITCP